MANREHQNILRKGIEVWNEWRASNPKIKPDLSGLNLSGVNLSGADLTDTECVGTVLKQALLDRVNFSRANLVGTDFSSASIAFSRFVRTIIENVSF